MLRFYLIFGIVHADISLFQRFTEVKKKRNRRVAYVRNHHSNYFTACVSFVYCSCVVYGVGTKVVR